MFCRSFTTEKSNPYTDGEYTDTDVPVDTLDNMLAEAGVEQPKLVSITANGAEPEILNGLGRTLSKGVPYISLAVTGKGYEAMMAELGYELIAYDDRGFTFRARGI